MATLFHVLQFLDNSGNPLSFGKVYWEAAGTSNPKTVWKDAAETATHTYPINLDIAGRPPSGAIFLRGSYKLIVKDQTEAITYVTIDYINEYNQYDFTGLIASVADLNSTKTVALNINTTFTTSLSHRGATLLCDATSASFNINLLPAVTALNTYKIIIKKVDVSVNIITLVPNGSEKIDTDIDLILYDFNDFVEIHCDGSNWKVVASQIRGTIIKQIVNKTLTLEDNGKMFNCDSSTGAFRIDLPDCRVVGRGYKVIFKKIDSSLNHVTIYPNGSQTIDDGNSYDLSVYTQVVGFKTNGLNWCIIFESRGASGAITGDVKASYNNTQSGWVIMNDGSIGNLASNATTRKNADTQNLFVLLWNRISNTWCPVQDKTGTPVGRGLTALDDFNNDRRLVLTKMLGRSLISTGQAAPPYNLVLGEAAGENTHIQSLNEVGNHAHKTVSAGFDIVSLSLPPTYNGTVKTDMKYGKYSPSTSSVPGAAQVAFNLLHPITAIEFYIKL